MLISAVCQMGQKVNNLTLKFVLCAEETKEFDANMQIFG